MSDFNTDSDDTFENNSAVDDDSRYSNDMESVVDSDQLTDISQVSSSTASNESSASDDTEPYDIDEQILTTPANRNNRIEESVIEINDTQPALIGGEEDGADDVILIPPNIETIDLCTQQFETVPAVNNHFAVENVIIEITDSPNPRPVNRSRVTSNNIQNDVECIGPIRQNSRAQQSSTPYQRNRNRAPLSSSSNTPKANPALNESQECSQTQKVAISCPICLESVINRMPQSTACGHIFCKSCLQSSLQACKKCPLCRKPLGKNGFHSLHFP